MSLLVFINGNKNGRALLGVNIDHIATVRNARGTQYPDPVQAAFVVSKQLMALQCIYAKIDILQIEISLC